MCSIRSLAGKLCSVCFFNQHIVKHWELWLDYFLLFSELKQKSLWFLFGHLTDVYLWADILNENEIIWNAMDARLVTLIRWTTKQRRSGIQNHRETRTWQNIVLNTQIIIIKINRPEILIHHAQCPMLKDMQQLNPNWNSFFFLSHSLISLVHHSMLPFIWSRAELSWADTETHNAYCVWSYFSFYYFLKWFNENEKNRFGYFLTFTIKSMNILYSCCICNVRKGTDPTAAI